MGWTKQQQNAIENRNNNLLVAAAAGSGKTAVLVERILQLITEENFDVDKILIVTFTNAAAAEMKNRIQKKINEKISTAADTELIEKLERQSILLSGASIMTIHAFCLSVLRRHFSKINLDPKFREADEYELNILKQEVIEDLFEKKYSENNSAFNKFTDEFGGNMQGDSKLHEVIIKLHEFAQSRPYPQKWLNSLIEIYKNPATFKLDDGTIWLDAVQKFALDYAKNILKRSKANCEGCRKTAEDIGVISKTFEEDSEQIIKTLKALDDWNKFYKTLREINFSRFNLGRNLPPDIVPIKENLKNIRDNYKKEIETLCKDFFTATTENIIAEMQSLVESVCQLVQITIDFDNAFASAKRDKNIIDFGDMEHLTLKIFNENPSAVETYQDKFKMVMVDEYQDTNGVQEEIISKIVSPQNFFAVGDVKQSIYRFRNADPTIFLDKYKNYPLQQNCQRIDLSENFRSRESVINAVNFIFENLMKEETAEINYDAAARLNPGANFSEGENIFDDKASLSIINLNKDKTDEDSEDEENDNSSEYDKLEIEIQLIANKINSMIDSGKKVLDGEYRPIEFRDIVILLRSIDRSAAQIVEVLQKNNIPAYATDKDGYFKATEIQTILSLLKILENSRQDIPLATVLISPIGGFSTEDLAQLRINDRKSELFDLICTDIKFLPFLQKINRWREIARQVSVPELLNLIYRESGYYDYCAKFGKIAQANLRMLIDRAAAYEKTTFRGLSRFIQFIKKLKELGNDLAAARTLSESENVVRVMTIHKSKGLEFPVVFVAGLGKKFNLQDLRENIIPHRNFGIGIYNTIGNLRISTFTRKIIYQKVKAETLAEELRILYVAMTRAKEKLFLTGTVNNEKALNKTTGKINRPSDWILSLDNIEEVFDYEVLNVSDIPFSKVETAETEIKVITPAKIEKIAQIENIPAKISVTELKRRINEKEDDEIIFFKRAPVTAPASLSTINGVELGTVMHSVMQHLDFSEDLSHAGIIAQVSEMTTKQIINPDYAEIVKRKAGNIANFFKSAIGKKLLVAQEIYRELPFSFFVDAEYTKVFHSNEKILIQGIIDLLFKDDNNNWILVDYKTDKNNTDEYFRQEYHEQIKYYVKAVESIANIKISAQYLYLLGAGRFVEVNL